MGVDKLSNNYSESEVLLRLILISTPIYSYMQKLRGDDSTLPLASLLETCVLENGEDFWGDAEEQKICFNKIICVSSGWDFARTQRRSRHRLLEGGLHRWVWVTIRSVAMGSEAAVSIIQKVIRVLVLEHVGVDPQTVPRMTSGLCAWMCSIFRRVQTQLQALVAPESQELMKCVELC